MKKIWTISINSPESPKKASLSNDLRQLAGKKMLENKDFLDSLKLLASTRHSLLLQCVLETLNAIPNMIAFEDSTVDITFINCLIQILEDYLEDYKVKVGKLITKLLDKPNMQLLLVKYKITNIAIE